mgnify:CR=1 FL=1
MMNRPWMRGLYDALERHDTPLLTWMSKCSRPCVQYKDVATIIPRHQIWVYVDDDYDSEEDTWWDDEEHPNAELVETYWVEEQTVIRQECVAYDMDWKPDPMCGGAQPEPPTDREAHHLGLLKWGRKQ